MKHIILTAFGASESAEKTYRFLGSQFSARFPDARLHWSISSPAKARSAPGRAKGIDEALAKVLADLPTDDPSCCVVQSLHLTPGLEFHRSVRAVQAYRPGTPIGLPLLSSRGDFHRLADLLSPLLPDTSDRGVLLIGHGTKHPSWTSLPVLEHLLRDCYSTGLSRSTAAFSRLRQRYRPDGRLGCPALAGHSAVAGDRHAFPAGHCRTGAAFLVEQTAGARSHPCFSRGGTRNIAGNRRDVRRSCADRS